MRKVLLFGVVILAGASAANAQSLPEMRLTPAEVQTTSFGDSKIGSSGLAGIQAKVLFGDPTKAGYYSILLFVPAHTTIQAHSHRDDRVATVVSGDWQFGYGAQFSEQSLKTLPPGSVYSEPKGKDHFARTGSGAVIVQISGYGPTDTKYVDPKSDPMFRERH
jgi:quercetin dioxygenase-like cupin family protein